MSKSTPTPWRWEWDTENSILIYNNSTEEGNLEVAQIYLDGDYEVQEYRDEAEANAQLICDAVNSQGIQTQE